VAAGGIVGYAKAGKIRFKTSSKEFCHWSGSALFFCAKFSVYNP
jgi:hypothetical protein